jgi:hypothetical protein
MKNAMLLVFALSFVAAAQEKPRVFVTTSEAWQAVGGFGAVNGSGGGGMAAGSSPQTVEVIDDFAKNCPAVTVTSNKDNADFIVLFDRDAAAKAKTQLSKANKIAVFKKNGDLFYSGKTIVVSNAVKDACAAISGKGGTK